MFDGGLEYYAAHIFDDGEVLLQKLGTSTFGRYQYPIIRPQTKTEDHKHKEKAPETYSTEPSVG